MSWQEEFEHGDKQLIVAEVSKLVRGFGYALRERLCADKNMKKRATWKYLSYDQILDRLRDEWQELGGVWEWPWGSASKRAEIKGEILDMTAFLAFMWECLNEMEKVGERPLTGNQDGGSPQV